MKQYRELTAEEQRALDESVDGTGTEPGIEGVFPDGTHYDWDPELKATVETAPDGQRFVVELRQGKLTRVRSMPRDSDEALAAKARAGDLDAFEELVKRYLTPVLRLLIHGLGNVDDASRVAQDTMLTVWKRMQSEHSVKFSTLLFHCTRDAAIEFLRESRINSGAEPRSFDQGPAASMSPIPGKDPLAGISRVPLSKAVFVPIAENVMSKIRALAG